MTIVHTKIFSGIVGAGIVAAALTLSACGDSDTESTPTASMSMAPTSAPMMASMKGTFTGMGGKNVSGSATVADGKLMLSGFRTDEGPDLHVYLTNGTDEAAVMAGKQISAIDLNAMSQSFSLDGIDTSMYHNVVIHCDKAKVVFGAAMLS
ncbi:hypothetical protein GOAMR_09_00670 [Gordonia amarae NBRC 15530]|uniref:DM13 domain-containing protein n=2 Tax=Gordonia amarae TaxID=36821 RepID=G7GK95_9ACTN|nr:hypothetical protein GOAMR_09_00670 [Gordonia amarae NBRC 15530]